MSVDPGRYKATVEDYGIKTVGEKNTPQMQIKFKLDNGSAVYFQNFLTERSTANDYFKSLMDTLVETTLLRTKKFTDIAKGVAGGALATDVEVEVIVDYERSENNEIQKDKNGNPYVKVQYINNPKKSGMKGQIDEAKATSVLGALNLDAHIIESEQRTKTAISSSNSSQLSPRDNGADEVPF